MHVSSNSLECSMHPFSMKIIRSIFFLQEFKNLKNLQRTNICRKMRSEKSVKVPAQEAQEPVNEENGESNQQGGEETEMTEEEALFIQSKIKPFKIFELIFILAILGVGIYIYVGVLKRPFPKILKRVFGMDDTLYPEQYEKYLKAKKGQN